MNALEIDVWILDSSSVIKIKRAVPIAQQWSTLSDLETLVRAKRIAIPRLAINEIANVSHPDAPGVWAAGMRSLMPYKEDDSYESITKVMLEFPNVVDHRKSEEDADPWVLALALHVESCGSKTCIVTEDVIDRNSTSIATAASGLGLRHCCLQDFLGHLPEVMANLPTWERKQRQGELGI